MAENEAGDGDGIFDASHDAEKPADLRESPQQKPLSLRASDYIETGFVPVSAAADGGVLIGGGEPPEPALGLTGANLVCTETADRPECQFYVAFLTEAEGHTKGFSEARQIRRYCTRLQTASELMEIGETAVFACTARRPQDLVSIRLIKDFERRQFEAAAEMAQDRGEADL